ncbi:hypothetical protein GE21DRAFT_1346143 [Neurospora crassa]|nr:hypothetical protein GE21DRAFT_1346143 [Neurospora crassa]
MILSILGAIFCCCYSDGWFSLPFFPTPPSPYTSPALFMAVTSEGIVCGVDEVIGGGWGEMNGPVVTVKESEGRG